MARKKKAENLTAEEILGELLDTFHLGDWIYDVRESEGLGWDGPRVTRFNDICMRARVLVDAV